MGWARQSWRKQSTLGISLDGLLCVLPQRRRTPDGPDLTATIPDELLSLIFDFLPPAYSRDAYPVKDLANPLSLLFVCRRWQRCYTPILYRELYIKKDRRPKKLLKTLEYQPPLSGYIKTLDINIDSHRINIDALTSVVQHSCHVRKITLSANMGEELRPLLEAIARLEYLELLRLHCSPSMYTIAHQLERPSLRHLELWCYGWGIGDKLRASEPEDGVVFTKHHAKSLLPLAHHYTGALTSLAILNPAAPPEVTGFIICWPTALVRFTATLSHSFFAHRYTPASMERILLRQRHSLKDITLGALSFSRGQGGSGMLDFSSFHSLETLSMSCYNIFSEAAATTLQKLSAPLLHHLSISFATEEQHDTHFSSFGADEVTWFKNFASAANSANTALRTVFVEFDPDSYIYDGIDQNLRWPWAYLDEAAQALAEIGITLTYSPPRWTIEQWEEEKVQAKMRIEHDGGEY
ncbi:hypothetical protein MMC15_001351 [Xylographa vitiligo]|nr:hypothetical protein [Xylographa vitiligo]